MFSMKTIGLVLVALYAIFNTLNILYLYQPVSSVNMLVGAAFVYLLIRLLAMFSDRRSITQNELFAILVLFLLCCTVLAQNIWHEAHIDENGVNSLSNITTITKVSVMWFFVGGACAQATIKESKALALLLSIGVAGAMVGAIDETLTVPFREIAELSGVEKLSHLALEKYLILLLVLAYAFSSQLRFLTVALGVLALFLNGGRTALFVFLFTFILLNLRGNLFRNVIAFSLLSLGLVVAFFIGVNNGFIDLQSKVIVDILFLEGLESDGSFQGRVTLLKDSLPLLADQFWIGNYALVSSQQGTFAGYAHNLLSAWQFYGFFVFCALVISLIYCLRRVVYSLKYSSEPIAVFGSFLFIYVLISVILSKNVAWHLLWFAFGFWFLKAPLYISKAQTSRRRKRRKKVSSFNEITT